MPESSDKNPKCRSNGTLYEPRTPSGDGVIDGRNRRAILPLPWRATPPCSPPVEGEEPRGLRSTRRVRGNLFETNQWGLFRMNTGCASAWCRPCRSAPVCGSHVGREMSVSRRRSPIARSPAPGDLMHQRQPLNGPT